MVRNKLVTIGVVVLLVALIGGALLSSGVRDETKDRPAGDETEDRPAAGRLTDSIESALKNTATAEERYLTINSEYTDSVATLKEEEGLAVPPGISVTIEARGATGYCIEASDDAGTLGHYDSDEGIPKDGGC